MLYAYKDTEYKCIKETVRKYYKYDYASWTQPVLSSNGILGGSSFACANTTNSSSYPAWRMFDNNNSTFADMKPNEEIIFYNPIALAVTNIQITNRSGYNFAISEWEIYASNNNIDWTFITSGTNSSISSAQVWNITLNSVVYKYFKIKVINNTHGSSTTNFQEAEIRITATQAIPHESTIDDYDFYKDINIWKGVNR